MPLQWKRNTKLMESASILFKFTQSVQLIARQDLHVLFQQETKELKHQVLLFMSNSVFLLLLEVSFTLGNVEMASKRCRHYFCLLQSSDGVPCWTKKDCGCVSVLDLNQAQIQDFGRGGGQWSFDHRGAKFAQNRGFSLAMAWNLHDFENKSWGQGWDPGDKGGNPWIR